MAAQNSLNKANATDNIPLNTSATAEELIALAEELIASGKLVEAERATERILQDNPDSADCYNLLACVRFSAGELEDARDLFAKAYSLDPHNADAAKNLAEVCMALGQFDEAARVWGKLLEAFPEDPEIPKLVAEALEAIEKTITPPGPNYTPVTETLISITSDKRQTKGKVLLVTCLYENNFGDVLIYETIDRKLRNSGFDTERVEVSESLQQSKLIERANNCDFLYFVGGGIIERSAPEIIYCFSSIYRKLKVPYGVVGLSTGAFDYSTFSQSLKLFADNAEFFYTRDEESVETLKKAGASKLPLAGVDVVLANDVLGKLHKIGDEVCASFRNVPYPDVTGDLDWAKWSEALQAIGVDTLIEDCHTAQEQLNIPISQGNILAQIASSNYLVAMRYHLILVGAMMGVLPIPICYCPKVTRLAEQLGMSDYALNIHDFDKLAETYNRLKNNEKEVRRTVQKNIFELKQQASEIIDKSAKAMEQVING